MNLPMRLALLTLCVTATQPAIWAQSTPPMIKCPERAVWKGTGSTDDASNFICRRP
jgi:hypothetical protein